MSFYQQLLVWPPFWQNWHSQDTVWETLKGRVETTQDVQSIDFVAKENTNTGYKYMTNL